jgi:DEAD/DEAH box helicase domain-containing protein
MLNIMFMRRVEAPIFDATRAWLARDSRNLFHFVIDELHTHRGTPGAEVAYLLGCCSTALVSTRTTISCAS